jgi:hypothetical protein
MIHKQLSLSYNAQGQGGENNGKDMSTTISFPSHGGELKVCTVVPEGVSSLFATYH